MSINPSSYNNSVLVELYPYASISFGSQPITLGTSNGLSLSDQALSLALATASTPGALPAIDKMKLDSITSIGSGAIITNGERANLHAAVSIATPNGLSLSEQAISLALATASSPGALSGSDKAKLDRINDSGSGLIITDTERTKLSDLPLPEFITISTNSAAIGDQAIALGVSSIQLGSGTNASDSTLQFLDNAIADATSLLVNYVPVNYTPNVANHLNSHLSAIDQTFAAIATVNDTQSTTLDSLTASSHSPLSLGTSNGLSLIGQTLSLSLATNIDSGALSATDKTKLNSITSVGSGSIISTTERSSLHSPVTLGATASGLSLSGQEISLAAVTTTTAGAMIASDKTKLNAIASTGSGAIITSAERTALHPAVTVAANTGLSVNGSQQVSLAAATTTVQGAMSASDKTKLNTITSIGSGAIITTTERANFNAKVGSSNNTITNIISLTQAEYDALTTKVSTTLYVING